MEGALASAQIGMNAAEEMVSPGKDIATPSGKGRATENFPVGSLLIRSDLRRHVHAYYRFARMADDIADNPALTPAEKVHRLDLMEAVLLGPGRGDVPVAAVMRDSLQETGVTAVHCTDLLVAFRQDACKQRYAHWQDLMRYCRYSASPVGRYLLDLHGESAAAREASDALCVALQVLNHLQDCKADYREMDRVYLPQEYLDAEKIDVATLTDNECRPGLRNVIDRMLRDTDALIAVARHLPGRVRNFRLRAESAAIVRIAVRLSEELKRRDPLAGRVRLSSVSYLLSIVEGVFWASALWASALWARGRA